jgi:hypothetical protein
VADILKFLNHIHCDLRKLSVEYWEIAEVSTGLLVNIVALYPDLEDLSLGKSFLHNPDDYCLISRLKKLSELNLSMYKVDYMYVQPYI